jgi:DNA-binding response OmpR family regulator
MILIIDDEHYTADIFRVGLEDYGFEVNIFTDPFEALYNF